MTELPSCKSLVRVYSVENPLSLSVTCQQDTQWPSYVYVGWGPSRHTPGGASTSLPARWKHSHDGDNLVCRNNSITNKEEDDLMRVSGKCDNVLLLPVVLHHHLRLSRLLKEIGNDEDVCDQVFWDCDEDVCDKVVSTLMRMMQPLSSQFWTGKPVNLWKHANSWQALPSLIWIQ